MREQYYDKLLNIQTTGEQAGFNDSLHYHRYEVTPYSALEQLFNNYQLKKSDHLVDFGCGKGRLNFFLHHRFQATVTGIEMNEIFFEKAIKNRSEYLKIHKDIASKINFFCCLAQDYKVDNLDNRFYFFNPFSIPIFMSVVKNILISMENSPREVDLILYYPSEDYIYFLEYQTPFELFEEISLNKRDQNERFLIYRSKY
ncbi:methyltransferase [Cytobacillus sp. FJAT-54145]|uniref:Methyltransferase n=1 Tax=Cytobacillus spartinae TaxID=3299023 RepID=A0ABW6KEN5_9BACI